MLLLLSGLLLYASLWPLHGMGNMVEMHLTMHISRPAHQVRDGNNRAKRSVENNRGLYPQTLGEFWPASAEDGAAKEPHTTSRETSPRL